MSSSLRMRFLFILLIWAVVLPSEIKAQCVGIPSITALGSNKFPVGLCAPVQANVTYTVAFTSPVAPGQFELVYDWGDGSAQEIVVLETGSKSYNASLTHTYPEQSDCEYFVSMAIRYKGKTCPNTTQIQKISSWRTDAYNGGDVSLISPTTKTNEHLVCEGEDISVVFQDDTNWNCNSRYTNTQGSLIESANTEYRWQQIVYNTAVTGSKIPNVEIDDVPVTGANGSDIIARYHDPRGVHYMSAPVLVDDPRRRPSLKISARGGFGPGFPKAGDVLAVTLRYWNFCNPYDDPEIPGPPIDVLNGDHPPVEKQARIRVVAPPPALSATGQAVCYGTTPQAFAVSGVTSGNQVNWYQHVPGSDEPGALIASGNSTVLAVTAHPEWSSNTAPTVLRVWAKQRASSSGAMNCESPKVLVTRAIREKLTVPTPTTAPPAEICNGESFTITFPEPQPETIGGGTKYTWTGSSGLALLSSSTASASFIAGVTDFGGQLYVDRNLTVSRAYVDEPACGVSVTYKIRIYDKPVAGTLSAAAEVCEVNAVGPITISGHVGTVARWEIRKDAAGYTTYAGEAAINSISPGILPPGDYVFRAVVVNGPCNEVYSNEKNVHVSANPPAAHAGDDQFICSSLQSAALTASFSDSGNAVWSYVKSLPAGLPSPSFDPSNPNTTVVIAPQYAGVYTLRWTVTNGSCSSYDEVVIDFGTNPTDPNAGNDKAVCGATSALEGNTPGKGVGSWSVVSGPGGCLGNDCPVSVLSPASPVSPVGLKGASVLYGAYTFRWSISSGGNNCFLKSDDVTITFQEPVKVNAPDIYGICLDSINPQPIELTGTVSGPVFSTAWSNVSGNGTVTSGSETSSNGTRTVKAVYQPSSADYESGGSVSVKLMATPASPSCLPEEKIITINFERKPVAYAGTDIGNICNDQIQLQATAPLFGAKGLWSTTQPGVTFDDASDPKTIIRTLPLGATRVTWTVSSEGGVCSPQSLSLTLTRVVPPAAHDITITACEIQAGSTSVVLRAYEDSVTSLPAADRNIAWFKVDASGAETPVANPAFAQTNVPGGQVYIARVRDTKSGCTSDASVTVTVRPLPPVMNAVITQCEEVTGSNMVSGIDLGEISFINAITRAPNVNVVWYSSEADALEERFPIVDPVTVNGQKEFFAKVTYKDAPYCSSIARLNIVVNPQPAVTTIIGRESVCQGISSSISNDLPVQVYQVMPIAGALYHWEIPDGPGQFQVFGGGGERDFYVLLQFPNVYSGKIRLQAEVNGCSGPVIEKEIAVSAAPDKPLIEGAAVVCENSSHVSFNVSPDNFPSSAYNWEVRKMSDNSIGGAYIMEGQLTGNVLVNFGEEDVIISVRENNAECVSPVATKVIKVADPPRANLVVQKEISCFMAADGVIGAEVAGGTAPFTAFEIVQTGKKDADNDGIFENLPQGTYSVRLKDFNGCFATSNVQVLKQPDQVKIERVEVPADGNGYNVSCRDTRDGAISVFFSGGTAGNYTVSLVEYNTSAAPTVLTGAKEVTFRGIGAGTYSIVVEDVNGCSSIPTVAFVVSPPELYAGAVGPDQVICSGQNPAVIGELTPAGGGTGYYEYTWQESLTGNVYNDAEWKTIPGETDVSYDPPPLTTNNPLGEQRHYRRIVKSISRFTGEPLACDVRGKTETVTITVNPKPEVEFTASAHAVCAGDAVALTVKLTTGKAPMDFDYATSSQTFANQRGPVQTTVTVPDFQKDEIFSLVRVADANGCVAEDLPAPLSVEVIRINPDFSIISPNKMCNSGEYTFKWQTEPGIDYRWEWGDGTMTSVSANAFAPGQNELTHSFTPLSTVRPTEYPVKLFASHDGCLEKVVQKSIAISPAIDLNILAGDTLLCSGETINFYNNSSGVDAGRWYYRIAGTTQLSPAEASADRNPSFTFENTTSTNPLIYEVIYEARNTSGCGAIYSQQVAVYRANRAAFEVDSVPAFDSESVQVRIQNTSNVIDTRQFAYTWNYGEQGTAKFPSDNAPYDITYYSPGQKAISLAVVNLAAREAGKVCRTVFREQITVPVRRLHAAFTATPFASCFPVTISVDNKSSGADTFLWKLFRAGALVTTSNLRYPDFRITEPGVYDIHLTASVLGTGERDEMLLKGLQVYEAPHAAFEIRADRIYVPDTELKVFNFSNGANVYAWHFGDGTVSESFEPEHMYQSEGRYSVVLVAGLDHGSVDADGDGVTDHGLVCYDSARQEVVALQGGDLQIPNAFTPDTGGPNGGYATNGGFNDVFLPTVKGASQFHMQIYDRWGTLVFESKDKDIGWDGYDRNQRLMPAGVYIYKIMLVQSNGETVTRAGDVSLIR